MKTLLVTGFDPFLQFKMNPTDEIAKRLNGLQIGDYQIVSKTLPVDYALSEVEIVRYIQECKPDAVMNLGLAAGRSKITPERIAINIKDGAADNTGKTMQDVAITEQGPAGYFSTLPIRNMVNALNEKGYPAEISNSAGTYLCNNVMYTVLHTFPEIKQAGFIHIPANHEMVVEGGKYPSWSLRDLEESIKICIETL
jgi:pyroglutamyl-peptidase